jgi:hypothetical protein
MKRILLVLLSAISLVVSAQEKKAIVIQQTQGDNAMIASMITGKLTAAFANSDDWQPVERPSSEETNRRMLAGEHVGNLQPAQYILLTEIQEVFGELMISCKIVEIETALTAGVATATCEPTPQSIQQASSSLVNQLLGNPE